MTEISKIQTTVTAKLESVPKTASRPVNEYPYTEETVSAIFSFVTTSVF